MDKDAVEERNRSGATVLAVAYGSPKENLWIDRNHNDLTSVRIAIGIGGALDFISGEIPRAPTAMRKAGIEWLYRLWNEPKRYRRMATLPRFGWRVMRSRGK